MATAKAYPRAGWIIGNEPGLEASAHGSNV